MSIKVSVEEANSEKAAANLKADFDEIRHKLVPSKDGGFPLVDVKNFNDREESTIIEIAVLMNLDWVKILFVVPILSILTLMVLPIVLYWHSDARAAWFYKTTDKLDDARRILIVGRGKFKPDFKLLREKL
jgi:hypothetical protein